ncbi:hypothetical protein [Rhodobaculum claviforme]|uniref:Uncharacterized protein n=1 Tax=Rhodobaculum claviforme TaxID=1549854 RepID=A0A934TJU0_9RHOB|nr:hypothetical protein [Rhodobaculum claviforme]MBK5926904.1 hypothetical protein [Rhodobaculum claviforme]
MIRLSAAIAAFAVLATPALAEGYLYSDFEASVPHIDLPECPEGMADRAAICRVTINNDALHIHVFAEDGDQPFIAVHTFYEDGFALTLDR